MSLIVKMLLPVISPPIEKMNSSQKIELMEAMLPYLMSNMTFEDKSKMMTRMMPTVMKGADVETVDRIMDSLMPILVDIMKDAGFNLFELMERMCPKCVSAATSQASTKEKKKLRAQMTKVFEKI